MSGRIWIVPSYSSPGIFFNGGSISEISHVLNQGLVLLDVLDVFLAAEKFSKNLLWMINLN